MQFSALFAAAALSGLASAVVQLTNTVYNDITAGKAYSIGWSNATGPVTLTLKNGGANNLKTFSTITSGATTSPFSWDVPSSLPADTYAIEITDGSGTNYSPQFQLLGATASPSSSAASSTGSTTASSSASASTTVVTSTTGNSTASSTATGSSNSTAKTTGTSASKTSSGADSSKTSTGASSSSSVPASNSATEFASPLALVFLTFAAILSLN